LTLSYQQRLSSSWVYLASSTVAGALRTISALNTAVYANSSGVTTSVVSDMAINSSSGSTSVLALINLGSGVGVLSGLAVVPSGVKE
jgi:hypothetical protein